MTTVTVIGGAGFIGTRLCASLHQKGLSFEIIDIKQSQSFPKQSKTADIRNIDELRRAISGSAIIHLAAVHRDDIRDKSEYHTVNVKGTENVCRVAEELGISRIIFTSSVAVYGFAEPNTDESGAHMPFNDYGRTKAEAEKVLLDWSGEQKQLTIIRPTVVFGEGNRGNVYNLFSQINSRKFMMIGDGKNRKSMAYVGNLVAFIEERLADTKRLTICNYVDKPDPDMISLVSIAREELGIGRSQVKRLPKWVGAVLGKLADTASRVTGTSLPISSIRIKKFCSTTTFTSTAPERENFNPPFSLEEAIRKTIAAEFVNPDPSREIFWTE